MLGCVVLVACLVFGGCQKEVPQNMPAPTEADIPEPTLSDAEKSRLTQKAYEFTLEFLQAFNANDEIKLEMLMTEEFFARYMKYKSEPRPEGTDTCGTLWELLPLIGNIVFSQECPPPRSYRNISLGSIVDFSPGGNVIMAYYINTPIKTVFGRNNEDGTFREYVIFEMIYVENEKFLIRNFGRTDP
jgi:hypothetical protein